MSEGAEATAARLRSNPGPFRIVGSASKRAWAETDTGEPLEVALSAGLRDWHPADMVATAAASTRMADLQAELGSKGQCLPWRDEGLTPLGTLGGEVSMAFPHRLEGKFGSWRDWVLGMKVLLADGTVVKCGSRAVKNVAGYDLQRLLVGARGTLAVILEVTFRTYPVSVLDSRETPRASTPAAFIQRVQRSDFAKAVEHAGAGLLAGDEETATLWLTQKPVRFQDDWCVGAGMTLDEPTQIRLMKRAKQIFDPENKLNPGEWGFL